MHAEVERVWKEKSCQDSRAFQRVVDRTFRIQRILTTEKDPPPPKREKRGKKRTNSTKHIPGEWQRRRSVSCDSHSDGLAGMPLSSSATAPRISAARSRVELFISPRAGSSRGRQAHFRLRSGCVVLGRIDADLRNQLLHFHCISRDPQSSSSDSDITRPSETKV